LFSKCLSDISKKEIGFMFKPRTTTDIYSNVKNILIEHYYFFISGTPEDRVLASSIAALLCVQLGAGPESQDVFKTLKPHLITVIQDKTASSAARSNVRISHDQLLFCNEDIR